MLCHNWQQCWLSYGECVLQPRIARERSCLPLPWLSVSQHLYIIRYICFTVTLIHSLCKYEIENNNNRYLKHIRRSLTSHDEYSKRDVPKYIASSSWREKNSKNASKIRHPNWICHGNIYREGVHVPFYEFVTEIQRQIKWTLLSAFIQTCRGLAVSRSVTRKVVGIPLHRQLRGRGKGS